jgi:hypothetical protein
MKNKNKLDAKEDPQINTSSNQGSSRQLRSTSAMAMQSITEAQKAIEDSEGHLAILAVYEGVSIITSIIKVHPDNVRGHQT